MLALAGASALGNAAAQTPAQPVPASQGDAKPDAVAKAREDNRRSAEVLAKFEIPMATEPAFIFRP
jgi:hypothetical protein